MCLLSLAQCLFVMPRDTRIIRVPAQELSKCKKMCHTIDSEDAMLELQAAAKREGNGPIDQGFMACEVYALQCMYSIPELMQMCRTTGVPTRIVVDEGMEHNKTVLAMGPAPEQVLLQLLHGLAEL